MMTHNYLKSKKTNLIKKFKSIYQSFLLLALVAILGLSFSHELDASHIYGGQLSYTQGTDPGEVCFTFTIYEDLDFENVGDSYSANIATGDGSSLSLNGSITSINTVDQYFEAVTTGCYTYDCSAGDGNDCSTETSFTAQYSTCCKVSNLGPNSDDDIILSIDVQPCSDNDSPVSSLPPYVSLPLCEVNDAGGSTFTIPFLDPDGDAVICSLEPFPDPDSSQPTGLSIVPGTCDLVFQDGAATAGQLFNAFVCGDDGCSKTCFDFTMEIVNCACPVVDPTFSQPVTTSYSVCEGEDINFNIAAADINGSNINLFAVGVPAGSNLTLTNNNTAAPTGTFAWATTFGDAGTYVMTLLADNGCGNDQVVINLEVLPVTEHIILGEVFACPDEVINLTVTNDGVNAGAYTTVTWTGDIGGLSSTTSATPTFSSATPGTYNLLVETAGGTACGGEGMISIVVQEPPTAPIDPIGLDVCEGGDVSGGISASCGLSALITETITVTSSEYYDDNDPGFANYGSVTFTGFPAGAIISDVDIEVIWEPIGGSNCAAPGGGSSYACEAHIEISGPGGSEVLVNTVGALGATTYGCGNINNTGVSDPLTIVFDQAAAGPPAPGSLPMSGTFQPGLGDLDNFNGQLANSTFTLIAGDDVGSDGVCFYGFSVTVTVAPSSTTLTWYDAPTGGILQGTANPLDPTGLNAEEGAFNVNTSGTYTFYAVCEDSNGCESAAIPVTVTVWPEVSATSSYPDAPAECRVELVLSDPSFEVDWTANDDIEGALGGDETSGAMTATATGYIWDANIAFGGVASFGDVSFTITNPNAPATLDGACQEFVLGPIDYLCCVTSSGEISGPAFSYALCEGESISSTFGGGLNIVNQSPSTVSLEPSVYASGFLLVDSSTGIVISWTPGTGPVDYSPAIGFYEVYAYNYNLLIGEAGADLVGQNIADIQAGVFTDPQPVSGPGGGDSANCASLSNLGATISVYPALVVECGSNGLEGLNGNITPFWYNTHQITISGGLGPYSVDMDKTGYVTWAIQNQSASSATVTINYADNAEWCVSIVDAIGCTVDATAFDCCNDDGSGSGNPSIPGANGDILDIDAVTISSESGVNSDDGSIELTIAGCSDAAGPSYEWSGPNGYTSTDAVATDLGSGLYYVTVTCDGETTTGWYWVPLDRNGGRMKISGDAAFHIESFPNPFSDQTTLAFSVENSGLANVQLFTVAGKLVNELFNQEVEASSTYYVDFSSEGLSNGTYIAIITDAQGKKAMNRIVLMK